MNAKSQRLKSARLAVQAFQDETGTDDADAVCDLVANLMHLAAKHGQDPLEQVRRGIYHWYAETHNEAHSTVTIAIVEG